MTKRTKYTQEFKVQALELVKQTGSYAKAARQLGITDSLLHAWKEKYNFDPKLDKKTAGQAVADTIEVQELKKKIAELEKVNYILKRAAAFFSQDQLK